MTTTESSPTGQAPPVALPIDVTTVAHLQGPFAPVTEETDAADLPIEGELPRELDGVYLRNGPNPRFTPLGSYVYPLDGDGMVHAGAHPGRPRRLQHRGRPVIDPATLAELPGAATVRAPICPLRTALSAPWHLHFVPASPQLFDAVLQVPVMDVTRARTELGWSPRYSALDAIQALLDGHREDAGMDTPPLTPDAGGPLRCASS